MKETTHMLLVGEISELIIKLDPTMYRKYILENRKAYVRSKSHYI